jgi:hypothetical protein
MADETKKVPMSAGLPAMPEEIILAPPKWLLIINESFLSYWV